MSLWQYRYICRIILYSFVSKYNVCSANYLGLDDPSLPPKYVMGMTATMDPMS